jgi:hypothetical protein
MYLIWLFSRHFQQVVDICVERIRSMSKSHMILYWHQCLQYIYRYLTYHRL